MLRISVENRDYVRVRVADVVAEFVELAVSTTVAVFLQEQMKQRLSVLAGHVCEQCTEKLEPLGFNPAAATASTDTPPIDKSGTLRLLDERTNNQYKVIKLIGVSCMKKCCLASPGGQ